MKLSDNPFAILNASPRDSRQKLTDRADEASLIGGQQADEALSRLLQTKRRIPAEVSWFPGTNPNVADTFVRFSNALSNGESPRMPPVHLLGTPLAQANALAGYYERWPAEDPEYIIGICRSMDMILRRVNPEETRQAINQDREFGGWEPIPDDGTIEDSLEERIRELCGIIGDKMAEVSSDANAAFVLARLLGYQDFDAQGAVAQAVSDAYLVRIHDQEEHLRKKITDRIEKCKEKCQLSALSTLRIDMDKWCRLTEPLRRTPGTARQTGRSLCQDMWECIRQLISQSEPVKKSMQRTEMQWDGSQRVITLTYSSKAGICESASEYMSWLASRFPEQVEIVEKLKEDQRILVAVAKQEEAQARAKLYGA